MNSKQLLTIEFRYSAVSKGDYDSGYRNKIITIGIFETIEEAVNKGNEVIKILAEYFQVRSDDKFKVNGLFGFPDTLVSNCCYPTNGIQYFAKIDTLHFVDLTETIKEIFAERKEKVDR